MINKLLTCCLAGVLSAIITPAQTLFAYGPKAVSQAEFMRAFEKNPEPGSRRKALENYLPLFINYKLKVQDALDKKMDTLPNQQSELENYRLQLAENFVNTKANTKALVKEAFERSQKDILLGHLFIGFEPGDSNSIKQAATNAAAAREALKTQDLATIVNNYSTDAEVKASGGNAGWITVFSIPYNYETAVYNLPVGGYSAVLKGISGYHIFKKIQERPAQGKVKIAQIMLINTDPADQVSEEKNKKLADSLYQLLQKGATFDSLAMDYSNDRTSYDNGGVLPEFGVGTYDPLFEEQAFNLKAKGDISKPFKTTYGWHILKLIDKTPVSKTIEDADQNNQLTEKVMSSGRAEAARNAYLETMLIKLGYKPAAFNENELWQFTDSAITTGNIKGQKITGKTILFSFTNSPVTADKWLQYVKTIRLSPGGESRTYPQLLKAFTIVEEQHYLQKNLPKIDPAFNMQYKEFKDANLLFEAMDKNVWNKASLDTAGLSSYYNNNKSKYRWGPSAIAVLVTCTDSSITDEVHDFVKKDPSSWRQLQEKYTENIIADSGRYELTQLPLSNVSALKKGMVTMPVKNELDRSQTFAAILDLLPAEGERSFEDARGFVINDYQQVLEQRWLAALKKKYPVKVNQAVWNKLLASM
jgi:peptidyl-prolyl cis-trans isomerase SurA